MNKRILLCTDLDRTLLPNGAQEESSEARPAFRRLVGRPEIGLAYVSGRNQKLIREAIQEYDLPQPDYAIGDVGTTMYRVKKDEWQTCADWSETIAADWNGRTGEELVGLLSGFDQLRLQEPEKQNTFKVSYYAPTDTDAGKLVASMRRKLAEQQVKASLIWSIDEAAHTGLLDVLPECATKLHAIEFLIQREGFDRGRTVFAGDSGNDLPALVSGLNAVLVRNARDSVRDEALQQLAAKKIRDRLYLAQGGFLGLNGNYGAGVLEGLAYFFPETEAWMRSEAKA